MLLSGLFILVGGIILPAKLELLYSTHIIVSCLYLIYTKRLIALCLLIVSIISVAIHEWQEIPVYEFLPDQVVYVDFASESIAIDDSEHTLPLTAYERYGIRWRDKGGRYYQMQPLKLTHFNDKSSTYKGVIKKVIVSAKGEGWIQNWLYSKRLQAQLEISFDAEQVAPENHQGCRLDNWVLKTLNEGMGSFESWRLTQALILGRDQLWSAKDTWMVRSLGLSHLFVVSGLHAGFVYLLGVMLARCIWWCLPASWLLMGVHIASLNFLVITPMLLLYAYLTQWGEPIVRASLMLGAVLLANIFAVRLSASHLVGFALWLILLIEPRSILQPSLWLSFSMVILLIVYCQPKPHQLRLISLQIMLSLASMVLILGWQTEISIVTILANLLMVPLVAFIWFPVGAFSAVEWVVFKSTYVYQLLDFLIGYVLQILEWLVFHLPMLGLWISASQWARSLLIVLILYWVYHAPLKRSFFATGLILVMLIQPFVFVGEEGKYRISHKHNELIVTRGNEWLFSDAWHHEAGQLIELNHIIPKVKNVAIATSSKISLLREALINKKIKWLLIKKPLVEDEKILLRALRVNWLQIAKDGYLDFYMSEKPVRLHYSPCHFTFFTFKSDTCKRIELLENMLN
ncbi:ComEC/Rec2 family competence protein [Marinomonas dokdonensis]|uniref:ComEC/Rec2 family competence protein n=1 Tax=Marinomonas dokdonensis TaxID=328224 RepID=UPI004055553D